MAAVIGYFGLGEQEEATRAHRREQERKAPALGPGEWERRRGGERTPRDGGCGVNPPCWLKWWKYIRLSRSILYTV